MEYEVTIRVLEEFKIRVEADDDYCAIAKAFDNAYAWRREYTGDRFDVSAKEAEL